MCFWLALIVGGVAHAGTVSTLDAAAKRLGQLSGAPVRMYSTRDFGRDRYVRARSVIVDAARALPLVEQLRPQLGAGWVVFVGTENNLADVAPGLVEVVVGPGRDQFDILRIAASDAVNYDMTNEDLIRQLKQWDAAYGIDIYQADTDSISLRLKTIPSDLHGFAVKLYKFCPDIVDQGVGSVEKLEKSIRDSHGEVFLWWD